MLLSEKRRKRKPDKPPQTQYAEFVSMSDDEYSSLTAKLGEDGAKRCVEILDNYKGASGKKYASDYRAILNWVIKRYDEERVIPPASNSRTAYSGGRRETQNERNNRMLDDYFGGGEPIETRGIKAIVEYDPDEL
jgi:hypothetical protein